MPEPERFKIGFDVPSNIRPLGGDGDEGAVVREIATAHGGVPGSVWELFTRSSLAEWEMDVLRAVMVMVKAYMDEDFNETVAVLFWKALGEKRFDEAFSYLLPCHASVMALPAASLGTGGVLAGRIAKTFSRDAEATAEDSPGAKGGLFNRSARRRESDEEYGGEVREGE